MTGTSTPPGGQRSTSRTSNVTRSTDASMASKVRKMTAADLEKESSEETEPEAEVSKSGGKVVKMETTEEIPMEVQRF